MVRTRIVSLKHCFPLNSSFTCGLKGHCYERVTHPGGEPLKVNMLARIQLSSLPSRVPSLLQSTQPQSMQEKP